MNTADDIANIVLGLVAGNHVGGEENERKGEGDKCNGLAVYAEGGRGWDIESGLAATRDEWLGKEPNEALMAVGRWFASGAAWTSDQ